MDLYRGQSAVSIPKLQTDDRLGHLSTPPGMYVCVWAWPPPARSYEAFPEGSWPTDRMGCASLLGWRPASPNVLAAAPSWPLTHTPLTSSLLSLLCHAHSWPPPQGPCELHTSQVSYQTPWAFQVQTLKKKHQLDDNKNEHGLSPFWHHWLFECLQLYVHAGFPTWALTALVAWQSISASSIFSSLSSASTSGARRSSITQSTVWKLYFKTHAEHFLLLCAKMWMFCA